MADWSFDGIRIFVVKKDDDEKQIIAKLQPINNHSIYHIFGYESMVAKVEGYVVGNDDMNAIRALVRTGDKHALYGPFGFHGNYFLSSLRYNLQPTICQTLRRDLPKDSPVYSVSLELYHHE
jgi:hypothetical protein